MKKYTPYLCTSSRERRSKTVPAIRHAPPSGDGGDAWSKVSHLLRDCIRPHTTRGSRPSYTPRWPLCSLDHGPSEVPKPVIGGSDDDDSLFSARTKRKRHVEGCGRGRLFPSFVSWVLRHQVHTSGPVMAFVVGGDPDVHPVRRQSVQWEGIEHQNGTRLKNSDTVLPVSCPPSEVHRRGDGS